MYAEHHAQDVHRVMKRLFVPVAQWHPGRRFPPHRAKRAPGPKHRARRCWCFSTTESAPWHPLAARPGNLLFPAPGVAQPNPRGG
eukprot:15260094-Alexandrium_andersonii.AAC.1